LVAGINATPGSNASYSINSAIIPRHPTASMDATVTIPHDGCMDPALSSAGSDLHG